MQNKTQSQNPFITALGIAAYHGCINPQDLLNARPDLGWPSLQQTENCFWDQYQDYTIHVFYCQRDDQVFSLEASGFQALWDYAIDPEEQMPPCYDLTEDQIWAKFLELDESPTINWFDYYDPETKETHHIVCLLDI